MKNLIFIILALGIMSSCANNSQSSSQDKQDSTKVAKDEMNIQHFYVDLGLPSGTLWATFNVGATKIEDYGEYFAWGETQAQEKDSSSYSWKSYKWSKGSDKELTKYCTDSVNGAVDGKMALDSTDDVAAARWGSEWRMPTVKEMQELLDNCDWQWVENYKASGISGRIAKSKLNGETLFFPAAGDWSNGKQDFQNFEGIYRTSNRSRRDKWAQCLVFVTKSVDMGNNNRFDGVSVRPVRVEKK